MYVCMYVNKYLFVYIIGMLLEDCSYKKTFAYFRGRISKGELVKMLFNQWIVAYSIPPIFIDCQKDQLKNVNPKFTPYLLAVENLYSRYDLFINKLNSLAKCMLLNVGDKVDVMLEQCVVPASAVIRYKGQIPRKKGIFFGVELLVSQYALHWLPTYVIIM